MTLKLGGVKFKGQIIIVENLSPSRNKRQVYAIIFHNNIKYHKLLKTIFQTSKIGLKIVIFNVIVENFIWMNNYFNHLLKEWYIDTKDPSMCKV